MDKINLNAFTAAAMNARLFNLLRTYVRKEAELVEDRNTFDMYVKAVFDENFEVEEHHKEKAIAHLSLFLLGKPSLFDTNRLIKISNEKETTV